MDLNRLFKTFILAGFTLLFVKLLISEQILYYVHPRIIPYLELSIIFMLLMICCLVKGIKKSKREKLDFFSFIVFLVPIILALFVSPSSFAAPPQSNANPQGINIPAPKPIKPWTGTLYVDNKNFLPALNSICDKPNLYQRKKIKIYGYVYHDEGLAENQFIIARSIMICCVADLQVIGILCQYQTPLNDNTWIKVEGTIKKVNFQDQDTAEVIADKITIMPKPKEEYVYP